MIPFKSFGVLFLLVMATSLQGLHLHPRPNDVAGNLHASKTPMKLSEAEKPLLEKESFDKLLGHPIASLLGDVWNSIVGKNGTSNSADAFPEESHKAFTTSDETTGDDAPKGVYIVDGDYHSYVYDGKSLIKAAEDDSGVYGQRALKSNPRGEHGDVAPKNRFYYHQGETYFYDGKNLFKYRGKRAVTPSEEEQDILDFDASYPRVKRADRSFMNYQPHNKRQAFDGYPDEFTGYDPNVFGQIEPFRSIWDSRAFRQAYFNRNKNKQPRPRHLNTADFTIQSLGDFNDGRRPYSLSERSFKYYPE